jgi:hypothetical protein
MVRIKQKQETLEGAANMVWKVLEELQPPLGWHPLSPKDQFIQDAFDKGWPKQG